MPALRPPSCAWIRYETIVVAHLSGCDVRADADLKDSKTPTQPKIADQPATRQTAPPEVDRCRAPVSPTTLLRVWPVWPPLGAITGTVQRT